MRVRTNLASGILFGIISLILLLLIPSQVALPAFDTGGPSPRAIPYIVLGGMLLCSIGLIVQSLVFKKEKIIIYDLKIEKAALIILASMILFGALTLLFGFLIGVIVGLPIMLFLLGERTLFIYLFTIAAGIGVYYLFLNVFHISLPAIGG